MLEGSEKSKGQKNQERWEARDSVPKQRRNLLKDNRTRKTFRMKNDYQSKRNKNAKMRGKGNPKSK